MADKYLSGVNEARTLTLSVTGTSQRKAIDPQGKNLLISNVSSGHDIFVQLGGTDVAATISNGTAWGSVAVPRGGDVLIKRQNFTHIAYIGTGTATAYLTVSDMGDA